MVVSDRDKNGTLFKEFWSVYPKRQNIGRAERAFTEAILRGNDPLMILAKARSYASKCNPKDYDWIPFPHTWLADDRFLDEDLFTDQAVAEKAWLRGCWVRYDVAAVEERFRVKMPRPVLPEDIVDDVKIREWYRLQCRAWIAEMGEKI